MNKKYIVKNAFPAGKWQDATPLGNGRVGALVYGSVKVLFLKKVMSIYENHGCL